MNCTDEVAIFGWGRSEMRRTDDTLRIMLCLLSIVLLGLLGAVGEELLNLPRYHRLREGAESMSWLTHFFITNFHLNAGHFWLSVTPFMILMLGVAGMSLGRKRSDLFWFLFVGAWLLA